MQVTRTIICLVLFHEPLGFHNLIEFNHIEAAHPAPDVNAYAMKIFVRHDELREVVLPPCARFIPWARSHWLLVANDNPTYRY